MMIEAWACCPIESLSVYGIVTVPLYPAMGVNRAIPLDGLTVMVHSGMMRVVCVSLMSVLRSIVELRSELREPNA